MEGRNLRDTIASAFSNLVAVVTTQSNVKLDVDVIAAFALGSQLAASSFDKGECATVMVWCVIAASHEDDYIGTWSLELRRSDLSGGERRESANGESLTDGRHY